MALAFDEGLVGLVGRLAEPINLADAQKHPSFKYIPAVKEDRFRAFLGVPIIQRRQLLGVLVVQQRELRQFDESEESFLVTLATQMAAILSQSQLNALFGPVSSDAHSRPPGLFRGGDRRGLDGRQPAADGAGV
ncbi:phosphocarrier protein kinase/phosphorylase [Klebsiella aerogenes]|nr:phosphocarrier protein kinase/phosphorylase [Klebsiella aerogenes]